jgi:hypothetical protein
VDSGADSSLLDASYASVLGLRVADADRTDAVAAGGGKISCLQWPGAPLEIQFENRRFPFEGQFVEFPPGSDPLNLMGRSDFFQQYSVQFWDAANLMHKDLAPHFFRRELRV